MRLYQYAPAAGGPRVAVEVGGRLVDLERAWTAVKGDQPGLARGAAFATVQFLLQESPDLWAEVAEIADRAAADADAHVALSDVTLFAPIVPASLRDFLAFEDHVERGAARRGAPVPDYWYEAPVYYKGNHHAILPPDAECPWPAYARELDFELELALVIGKRGRDVRREDAAGHIFGFTVFNDFSARDVQAKELSAWLGPAKAKDFANALGPCIVTADELGAEPDLEMICRVNGEEWGRARSSEMYWSWADIIAHVSAAEHILPGDVYGSGTPGGCCGLDLGRSLRPGDVVELEVERIGVLRNTIGAPPPSPARLPA